MPLEANTQQTFAKVTFSTWAGRVFNVGCKITFRELAKYQGHTNNNDIENSETQIPAKSKTCNPHRHEPNLHFGYT